VAAAVFGDASKVKYVPLSAQARLIALQSGEIDLLSRGTTRTLTRDTAASVNYYDAQGFMVAKKLGFSSVKQLSGATVCVQTSTTSELNLADFFRANKIELKPVIVEKDEEATAAFISGRCDAITTDASLLAAIRANDTSNPADYVILPERISKQPLGPAVRQGDDQWFDVVKWSLFAMIDAEERGVTSANVDEQLKSPDPKCSACWASPATWGRAWASTTSGPTRSSSRWATTAKSMTAPWAWARSCSAVDQRRPDVFAADPLSGLSGRGASADGRGGRYGMDQQVCFAVSQPRS
jgi:general L-amino acid transport system substrate-binding protein